MKKRWRNIHWKTVRRMWRICLWWIVKSQPTFIQLSLLNQCLSSFSTCPGCLSSVWRITYLPICFPQNNRVQEIKDSCPVPSKPQYFGNVTPFCQNFKSTTSCRLWKWTSWRINVFQINLNFIQNGLRVMMEGEEYRSLGLFFRFVFAYAHT